MHSNDNNNNHDANKELARRFILAMIKTNTNKFMQTITNNTMNKLNTHTNTCRNRVSLCVNRYLIEINSGRCPTCRNLNTGPACRSPDSSKTTRKETPEPLKQPGFNPMMPGQTKGYRSLLWISRLRLAPAPSERSSTEIFLLLLLSRQRAFREV